MKEQFDVIVIGGGHAGTEACAAAARMGAKTLLLTQNIDTIGQMSCNPAIGGIGKGHLVREIDALDGLMARAADKAGIQWRTLNARKGPAVRATRAQADRNLYRTAIQQMLHAQSNLSIFQSMAQSLILDGERAIGVQCQHEIAFYAKAIIVTAGTFLGGRIHVGLNNFEGGRAGDKASIGLADALRDLPFRVERLKTGTPPRIDRKTIDYAQLTEQPGDTPRPVFSFLGSHADQPPQVSCHITHTNSQTHDIIRRYLDQSPMFAGHIEGTGPRYCPSIEDKITRFADKDAHQIFLEPESLTSDEVYPNGISTSLPLAAQWQYVRSIAGLENAFITRPGYAIEYDFFNPQDLTFTLETKAIQNLWFAGQINGTTGYEEAGAQGLLAGINAARRVFEQEGWTPSRSESYLGVMVDDLVTQGTKEPYRMFTSRAEYRLLLREDNADARLTALGHKLGVVGESRYRAFMEKTEQLTRAKSVLEKTWVQPEHVPDTATFSLSKEANALDLLKRPELTLTDLTALAPVASNFDGSELDLSDAIRQQLEIDVKYSGYLRRQQAEIERQQAQENKRIPVDFDYMSVKGLSAEITEKLSTVRPDTIAQAKRIAGVTPAAISLILVYLKKHQAKTVV